MVAFPLISTLLLLNNTKLKKQLYSLHHCRIRLYL
nr:MAG TPA: hypothetical protein [Caudoviricetes sp.]